MKYPGLQVAEVTVQVPRSFPQLAATPIHLVNGVTQLPDGVTQLSDGVTQLSDGVTHLSGRWT
ncbi:hypothetical protein KKC22_04505 [Myxococcota bacterium]|nr:hypothetical protein [Myxococcota bacterium]